MCYERITCKIFHARKGIPKLREYQAISCFTVVYCYQMIEEHFLAMFSYLLASTEFSTETESRKESCTCKLAW